MSRQHVEPRLNGQGKIIVRIYCGPGCNEVGYAIRWNDGRTTVTLDDGPGLGGNGTDGWRVPRAGHRDPVDLEQFDTGPAWCARHRRHATADVAELRAKVAAFDADGRTQSMGLTMRE